MRKFLAGVLALGMASLTACTKSENAGGASPTGPPVKVKIETVGQSVIEAPYETVGTIRSKTVSTIQSKVVGSVLAVHVAEGDRVEAGKLLVEIDDREARAQLQKAESGLAEAQQALQEIDQAINAAESGKKAAEAQSALAQSTYERFKGLADNQAVSRQALDEADAKRKAATAEAARADEMFKSSQAKRGEVQARIEQAKAELENVKVALTFTKIAAPLAGVVTVKKVDVGDMAAPGAPLIEIEDSTQLRLEAMVDEEHVGLVQAGKPASVRIDALGDKTLTGTVAEVVPTADPGSRTFVVKVDLPQTESLRSGMFGRVSFVTGQRATLCAPVTAVLERGALSYVFVVDERDIAHLRLVTTGKRCPVRVEILSGVNEGETIVAEGVDRVTDGCVVEREP